MPNSPDRRYTQEELRAIFQRAAARQEAAQAAARTEADGLTLAELQEIGAESGIDPAHVAAAAMELERPAEDDSYSRLAGGPTQIQVTRVVPGPVSDAAWTAMVEALRRTYDTPGIAGQVGAVREWTPGAGGDNPKLRAALKPEGNMARVSFSQSLKDTANAGPALAGSFGFMALIFAGLFAAGDFEPALWLLPALFTLTALVFFVAGRFIYGAYAQTQEQKLERLADRLELIALKDREAAAPDTAPENARAKAQTDAPLLDDAEEEKSSEASATERRHVARKNVKRRESVWRSGSPLSSRPEP